VGHEPPWSSQLVLNRYAFLNAAGVILPPASVMQSGFKGAILVGDALRNRPASATNDHPSKSMQAQPTGWHFECEEVKEGATCRRTGKIVVWVKTQRAWIRLLDPAPAWQVQAARWLEQMRLCAILCVCVAETPREAPDRILRQVVKAAMVKGGGKVEEDRLESALLEVAEFAAVEIERLWLGEGSKLSSHNGRKIVNKLIKDAEKERGRQMLLGSSKAPAPSKARLDKEDSSVGCVLASLVSRIEMDALREAFGLKRTGGNDVGRAKAAVVQAKEPRAEGSASKRLKTASGPAQGGAGEQREGAAVAEAPDEAAQGHWERDAEGKRVWVTSSVSASSDASSRGGGAAGSGRGRGRGRGRGGGGRGGGRAGGKAAGGGDGDESYVVGGRVRVNFDDGMWYVGKLESLRKGKWRVVFDDDDEMQLPDPDAIPVPALGAMVIALDDAANAVERALVACVASKAAGEEQLQPEQQLVLRKRLAAVLFSLRDAVKASEVGVLPEYMWSVEGVQGEMLRQAKARLLGGDAPPRLNEAQWHVIAADARAELTEEAAAAKADAPDSAPRKRKAGDAEGDAQSRGKKRLKGAQDEPDGAGGDAEGSGEKKEGKGGKRPKAWKHAPDWLEPDAIVEVESEGEWWQAKAVAMKKGKVRFEFVGGGEEDVEWLAPDSKRIRPSEGTPIEGLVGEQVQARRAKDKGELKDCWNLAVIVEVSEEEERPMVKVKYLERRGVKDEWLPIDTAVVRKVEGGGGGADASQAEGACTVENGPPWPPGKLAWSESEGDAFSSCLALLEFVGAFSGTAILMGAPVQHDALAYAELQRAWDCLTPARLLQIMRDNENDQFVTDLVVRLVSLLVSQVRASSSFACWRSPSLVSRLPSGTRPRRQALGFRVFAPV
jgi:hypothetical protein